MKKIDLPLLTDTIFMASVSLLFFFCLFRYYLRSFWAALACALAAAGGVAAAAYFLVRRKHRKRQEAGLSSAEIAKLTFHLAMEAPERAVKRLADALSAKHGAQAKILGNRIRAGGTDYYPLFQLEPVSADRIAPIVRAEGDKKAIAAGVLTPDAESLALAFGIAVMNAEEIYALLKETGCLPEEYIAAAKKPKNIKEGLKRRIRKSSYKGYLLAGVMLLLFSLITFFPVYYIVSGSLMLATAVLVRFFGKA